MSGRFSDTHHMYPVAYSIMTGLHLSDLLVTANTEPHFQSSTVSSAVETQQQYEQQEEEKRQLLRQKYEYPMSCMNYFACNHSIQQDVRDITYRDAMLLFQEVLSQMSTYHFDQRMKTSSEIYDRNHSQHHDETDQDAIALLTEKMVSHKKMGWLITGNRPYMIHYFTQKWMQRYPETDKTKLQKDLVLSYKAIDIMTGLSPKGNHVECVQEMLDVEIDSKEEWFGSFEQFQKDIEEFPEFAVYRGMDYV